MTARIAMVLVAALGTACAPTCRDIAAAEMAARALPGRANTPHAQLSVPLSRANALLARALRQTPRFPLEIPAVGAFLPGMSGFSVAPTSMRIEPARAGHVAVYVQGALYDRDEVVLRASVRGEIKPTLERDANGQPFLVFAPSKKMLRELRPEFEPGAADKLGDAIHRRLPQAARGLLDRKQARGLAQQLLSVLQSEGLQQFQDVLLPRIEHLLRLRLRLPDLPLERFSVRSRGSDPPRLTIDLYTSLPVHTGLSPARASAPGDGMELRFAGSTVAALANWAMTEGQLPRRYDDSLKPQPDGPNTLIFGWRADEPRPLELDIFRHQAPCAHIRVGAKADLALRDERIALTITERKIEQARGSALVKLKLWHDKLWTRAASKSHETAAKVRLEWGPRSFDAKIISAELRKNELRLLLQLGVSEPPVS